MDFNALPKITARVEKPAPPAELTADKLPHMTLFFANGYSKLVYCARKDGRPLILQVDGRPTFADANYPASHYTVSRILGTWAGIDLGESQ